MPSATDTELVTLVDRLCREKGPKAAAKMLADMAYELLLGREDSRANARRDDEDNGARH